MSAITPAQAAAYVAAYKTAVASAQTAKQSSYAARLAAVQANLNTKVLPKVYAAIQQIAQQGGTEINLVSAVHDYVANEDLWEPIANLIADQLLAAGYTSRSFNNPDGSTTTVKYIIQWPSS